MKSILSFENTLNEFYNSRHSQTAADSVFMSCMRNDVEFNQFIADLNDNKVFALDEFLIAESGTLNNFVSPAYRSLVRPLIDVTPGGNGGMASVGRGEFIVELFSNFVVTPSKSGCGDYSTPTGNEEVKFNGGKIGFSDCQGKEVNNILNSILKEIGYTLKTKNFVPFRKIDRKVYTNDEIEALNGYYWKAMTGENVGSLSDDEFKMMFLSRSFDKVFSVSDSIIVFDESGEFVRFFNTEDAVDYYSTRLEDVKLECRAKQSNPVTTYLFCHSSIV